MATEWKTLRSFLVFLLIATPACSVNHFGTSHVDRIEADGALLVSITGIGLHIDTFERSPSLSLGLYEATHIFSVGCPSERVATAAMSTAELFRILEPQLSVTRVSGVQLKAGPRELSLTIGIRELALLQSLEHNFSIFRILTYDANKLESTVLQACIDFF